jgi:hypothetical protein
MYQLYVPLRQIPKKVRCSENPFEILSGQDICCYKTADSQVQSVFWQGRLLPIIPLPATILNQHYKNILRG